MVPKPTELSRFLRLSSVRYHHYYHSHHHHHHYHHVTIIELCHFWLVRVSYITEVSSVVFPGSFCFLVCSFFYYPAQSVTRHITVSNSTILPHTTTTLRTMLPGPVGCECWVLSGRDLRDELITRQEESYQLRCIVVFHLETSSMRRPRPALGCSASGKEIHCIIAQGTIPCILHDGKLAVAT